MSADWGSTPYRRRVASQLGISIEDLDSGIQQLEKQEKADTDYRSLSHNDRLKAFANVIGVPLTTLAAVDGVSSILPDREPMAKASRRPPSEKKAPTSMGRGRKPKRKPAKKSTVPMKKFPWELDPPPRRVPQETEAKAKKPDGDACTACGLPFYPLTGACGCT